MKRNISADAERLHLCAGCNQCSRYCPAQIDLSKAVGVYGEYLTGSTEILEKMNEMEEAPVDCIECGACSARCPQGIDVSRLIRELAMMQSCQRLLSFQEVRR